MQITDAIFYIAVLVMSVVVHEVMHGFVAEYFGDKTARFAERLTLNPLAHLDPFGSVILPAFLVLTNSSFLFGWAKPVPYNPDNLNNRKWGTIAVASAGVLANLAIAVVFGIILRLVSAFTSSSGFLSGHLAENFYFIASTIVIVNLSLAIFNLVPIPPLDGSKILFSFLPASLDRAILFFEQYSLILLIIFIVFFANYLYPILVFLFTLITGLAF